MLPSLLFFSLSACVSLALCLSAGAVLSVQPLYLVVSPPLCAAAVGQLPPMCARVCVLFGSSAHPLLHLCVPVSRATGQAATRILVMRVGAGRR